MRDDSKPSYATISKNIANFPIARDVRVKLNWRKSKITGRWLGELPSEEWVQLRLPEAVTNQSRRWPTAFDMGVLFLLLSEARRRKTNVVEFQSHSAILELLGYSVEARNRHKVKNALTLWSILTIWFREWYTPNRFEHIDENGHAFEDWGKGRKKRLVEHHKRGAMQLPPPIIAINASRPVRITISEEWIKVGQRYFASVPLPLPRDAAAQNLVLSLLTSYQVPIPDLDGLYCNANKNHPRKVVKLCRKIGLNHNNRSSALRQALDTAQDWYAQHGGELAWRWPTSANQIDIFIFKNVVIRKELKQPVAKPRPAPTPAPELDEIEVREQQEQAEFHADMDAQGTQFDDPADAELAFVRWQRQRTMKVIGDRPRQTMTDVGADDDGYR